MNAALQDGTAEATRRQMQATDPNFSVWVSASAGSGKTKVLTDRFLRLLLADTRPQHILCLTYTQAAAAEMIERLTRRLAEWAVCDEAVLAASVAQLLYGDALTGKDAKTLLRQEKETYRLLGKARTLFAAVLDCPGGLRIKTFHAFAQEILARFPLEAGLAPHFTILDESESEALHDAALADMLRESHAAPFLETSWARMASMMDVRRLTALLQKILHDQHKLRRALQRYQGLDGLLDALFREAGFPPQHKMEDLLQAACADARLPMEALEQWQTLLIAEGKEAEAGFLQGWMTATPERRARRWTEYQRLFLTQEKEEPRKNILSAANRQAQPHLAETLAAEAGTLQDFVRQGHRLRRVHATADLIRLSNHLLSAYTARKTERSALDFDDIISSAAALLEEPGIAPWILWKLDGGLDHIMVDEAQDTSPAQWAIIRALTAEFFAGEGAHPRRRTLFVVGDEKQSIYSFQHAEPAQFHLMRDYFKTRAEEAGQDFIAMTLDTSFRSAPLVLQTVNRIFTLPRAQNGVGASATRHQASRVNAKGRIMLHPLVTPQARNDKAETWQPSMEYRDHAVPAQQLATRIAATVKSWLDDKRPVWVRERGREFSRPCRAGDVMILLRARGAMVPALIKALKQQGVPVAGADRLVLRTALAVQDMLAAVQFALLPEDDLNLACLLRSPFLNMDEATLERLCAERSSTLWQALVEDTTCHDLRHWLTDVLNAADQIGAYEFLARLLQLPCPAARSGKLALLRRLGLEAQDPLDELLNRAQHFDNLHPRALQHFLQHMLQDKSVIKRPLEHGAGEVRIMTVHAAKGLQAPIIILPDCAGVPRTQDVAALQWDEEETGLPFYTGGAQSRDAKAELLQQKAVLAQRQEYRRLLYVALTRAESELHIYGQHGEKPQLLEESWYRLIQESLAPEAETETPLLSIDETGIVAETDQVSAPEKQPDTVLPDWLFAPAQPEIMQRPLHPSRLDEDDAAASPLPRGGKDGFKRGLVLHRLLQYLPNLPTARRREAARHFLRRQEGMTETEADDLATEALRITEHPAYAPLFSPGSRAEMPLCGMVRQDGNLVPMSGQLDRLALVGDEVWVADYKTNRPPPADAAQVPAAYLRQMEAYRALLRQIYPGKTIRCFLLWTYEARIMELPEDKEYPAQARLA